MVYTVSKTVTGVMSIHIVAWDFIRLVCVKVQADRIAQLRQLAREQVDLEKRKMALLSKLQSEVQKSSGN